METILKIIIELMKEKFLYKPSKETKIRQTFFVLLEHYFGNKEIPYKFNLKFDENVLNIKYQPL